MNEIRRKKRSKKRGKSKNKEFMDAALDAFIRDQSLQKWNEVEGLREGAEINVMQAVKSSSEFLVKGPYRKIWVSWWKQDVIDHLPGSNEHLFGRIENAVRGAVLEEREIRKQQQKNLLEDSFEYKEFIARQMEHLLFEAGGDIEEDI
jgi:hypothetical protein